MKAQCLPFSQIPHTTRLFADFLEYSPKVAAFYPRSPNFKEWLKDEAASLRYDPVRRERVSAVLQRQNQSWNASPQTLANIARLRAGAAAVVTGQQVGLFGGPMFAIYKALSAIKLAEEATAAGVDCVPVFWLATSDHDLAEVNHVSLPGPDGVSHTLTTSSHEVAGAPVSAVRLGEEILGVVDEAVALLGASPVSEILRECYRPGETLGTAFARFYARLFGEWGIILLDASDTELHRIAEPTYRASVERNTGLNAALLARGHALEAERYHPQVKVTPSSVLLFALHNGARTPIHSRSGAGGAIEFVIAAKAGAEDPAAEAHGVEERLSQEELLARIASAPENFSPNVLLRPVVQDYLLPTLAYSGGPAETAYFAQVGAVYEILLGRVTPIVPRFSATLVEAKSQRLLERYEVSAPDVFHGIDALRQRLAERTLPPELQIAFDAANRSVEDALAVVREKLGKLDSTLVDAAQTAGSKMHHQLERLHAQATRAELRQSELIGRHAENLSNALYPENGLQERGIGGIYFLARHGVEILQSLHEAIHSECHDHQILEL